MVSYEQEQVTTKDNSNYKSLLTHWLQHKDNMLYKVACEESFSNISSGEVRNYYNSNIIFLSLSAKLHI